jgi:hypothetical protein
MEHGEFNIICLQLRLGHLAAEVTPASLIRCVDALIPLILDTLNCTVGQHCDGGFTHAYMQQSNQSPTLERTSPRVIGVRTPSFDRI